MERHDLNIEHAYRTRRRPDLHWPQTNTEKRVSNDQSADRSFGAALVPAALSPIGIIAPIGRIGSATPTELQRFLFKGVRGFGRNAAVSCFHMARARDTGRLRLDSDDVEAGLPAGKTAGSLRMRMQSALLRA